MFNNFRSERIEKANFIFYKKILKAIYFILFFFIFL